MNKELLARREAESSDEDNCTDDERNKDEIDEKEDGEEAWSDWEGEGEEMGVAICPVCRTSVANTSAVFEHCKREHSLDLQAIRKAHAKSNFYAWIQIVNFIRSQTFSSENHQEELKLLHESLAKKEFDSEKYLKPVLENDGLLFLENEQEEEELSDEEGEEKRAQRQAGKGVVANEAEAEPLPSRESPRPSASVSPRASSQASQASLHHKKTADIETEEILRKQLAHYAEMLKALTGTEKVKISKRDLRPDNDTYYFNSYSALDIHEQMLRDTVRTEAYRDAILNNTSLFQDKIVLDVGCGTGILSMFAAKSGAKLVIGVDCSDMIDHAKEIVKENGFADGKIVLLKGKLEELELPVEKVDIIISEWMGYALLYESMLDTVLFARDKWLAPGGVVLPDKTTVIVEAYEDPKRRLEFWDDVYGFKMTTLKPLMNLSEPFVEELAAEGRLSEKSVIKTIDINTTTVSDLDFKGDFSLDIKRNGRLDGLSLSFETFFEKGCESHPVFFSTSSIAQQTHWKQTFLAFASSLSVKSGDRISGWVSMRKGLKNPRELDIDLSLTHRESGKEISQKYHMT